MFKMLIVEDERWEREGLVDFLDWESMDISVVETASDGIEGMDKALEMEPDIIITDIQMPGRSGIEMAKLIMEQLPDVRIVVLTGYDDFEYAREALRFGAVDYVLKPVGEEEMLSTMLKTVQSCRDIRAKQREEELLLLEKDAVHHISLRQRAMDLLLGRGDEEAKRETISELRSSGYPRADAFSVWICSQPVTPLTLDTRRMEQLAGMALGRQVLVHSAGQGEQVSFALLIPMQHEETGVQPQLAGKLLQALDLPAAGGAESVQEKGGPDRWTLGTGSPVEQLEFINESFRDAQNTFNYAVFNDLHGVIAADEEQLARKQFTLVSEVFSNQFRELAKRLRYDLGSGGPVGPVMEELFSCLAAHPGAGRAYIASLLGGVIESCSSLAMPPSKSAAAAATDHMEALLACTRLQDMRGYTVAFVEEMARLLEEKRNRKDDYLINRVIALIEEQYGNQDLSLAYLAGAVFVSPNHLGMIFKKKTGKTPSEYIQEFRLQRAEEMLRTTKQRISVVAEQIGIPNASYFGLLYKQVYGMTPGEYREFVQR